MIDRIAAREAKRRDGEVQRVVSKIPPLTDAQVARVAALLTAGPLASTPEVNR